MSHRSTSRRRRRRHYRVPLRCAPRRTALETALALEPDVCRIAHGTKP